MSLYSVARGQVTTESKALVTTAPTAIMATLKNRAQTHKICISNSTGSPIAFSLDLYDSDTTTAVAFMSGRAIPANDFLIFDFEFEIPALTFTIRGTAATAPGITVHITYIADEDSRR